MKLKSPMPPQPIDDLDEFESWWIREQALSAMGLPQLAVTPRWKDEEEYEDWLNEQDCLAILRPARLADQARAARLAAAVAAATAAAAVKEIDARLFARSATAQPADSQGAQIGLTSLCIAPRITAQRPIATRVCAGLLHWYC